MEKMLITMVEAELFAQQHDETFKGYFKRQAHFFDYEGRCRMPTNFYSTHCYALGFAARTPLHCGQIGLIALVANLTTPTSEWVVGGTALTALMDVERRKGKNKPVIKKAMVELDGAPFKIFVSLRDAWAVEDSYISPRPIQFSGPTANDTTYTLRLECRAL